MFCPERHQFFAHSSSRANAPAHGRCFRTADADERPRTLKSSRLPNLDERYARPFVNVSSKSPAWEKRTTLRRSRSSVCRDTKLAVRACQSGDGPMN